MADGFSVKRYYNNLARLFQQGPVMRHRVANKVAGPGTVGVPIGTARAFLRHVNNAYASTIASYGQYNRLARYSDYNEMESMAEIHSALDIYADEATAKGEYGDILQIDSPNQEIRKALNFLFYDVLNIEFSAWNWIRNLCKYGDQFLLVDHHPDYGVLNVLPMPVNEVEREEGYDEKNPMAYRYRWITQGNRVLENWQVIHFRMASNDNFLPYGSSILEAARRVWRQLILMEDAVMVYRIVRSPERRVFYIDVGNVAPQDIPAFIEKAQTQLKRNQIIDTDTGRVDLRYNPLSTDEDYFIPTRGEFSSRIETLPGGQYTGDIDDLVYIQNKLFAALKIPKSYLGYEQDINAKATLSQEDVRFARTIQRIQTLFVAELNKIAIIHLFSMGFDGADLTNFNIKMANPSTIAEMQRLELWRTRFEVASVAREDMFDRNFIYKRLWQLNDEDIEQIEEGKRKDRLFDLELESMQAPQAADAAAAGVAPPGEEAVPPPEGEAPPPEAGAGEPAPPAPGMPPPPGEETPITANRDPNIQSAAPNDIIKPKKKRKKKKLHPDLLKHAFGLEKTAMDPKRSYSELTRMVRAPFGEGREDPEERAFRKNAMQLRKFAEDLETVDVLRSARDRKTKRVLKS
jgi:hypothetical protein